MIAVYVIETYDRWSAFGAGAVCGAAGLALAVLLLKAAHEVAGL